MKPFYPLSARIIVPEQYPVIARMIRKQEAGELTIDILDNLDTEQQDALIAEIRNLLTIRENMTILSDQLKRMKNL